MSKEHAKEFVEKAKKDKSIQTALHERKKHPVDIGKEHNLHFTHEEFEHAMRERNVDASDEVGWCSNTG